MPGDPSKIEILITEQVNRKTSRFTGAAGNIFILLSWLSTAFSSKTAVDPTPSAAALGDHDVFEYIAFSLKQIIFDRAPRSADFDEYDLILAGSGIGACGFLSHYLESKYGCPRACPRAELLFYQ